MSFIASLKDQGHIANLSNLILQLVEVGLQVEATASVAIFDLHCAYDVDALKIGTGRKQAGQFRPLAQRLPLCTIPPSLSGAGSHSPITSFCRSDSSNWSTVASAP